MLFTDLFKNGCNVTDDEILEYAYGIANYAFDRLPSIEEETNLRNLRARLREIQAAEAATKRAARAARAAPRKIDICRRCHTSSLDGAMFTTVAGGNVCDDCI